jgi:hypothetical protein
MVSIQTSLSVSYENKYSSLQTSSKSRNKKPVLNASVNNQISQFSAQIRTNTWQSLSDQNAIFHFNQLSHEDKTSLTYNNAPISELSVDEATGLIGENGFFGVAKTSQRLIDFVIKGAGDDLDKLKAGREGILRGFNEAEKAWGGRLPDISYETMTKSLEAIDEKIHEHGGSVVDLST